MFGLGTGMRMFGRTNEDEMIFGGIADGTMMMGPGADGRMLGRTNRADLMFFGGEADGTMLGPGEIGSVLAFLGDVARDSLKPKLTPSKHHKSH